MIKNLDVDKTVTSEITGILDAVFNNNDAYVAIDWLAKEEPVVVDWCKSFIPKYLHSTMQDSITPETFNQLIFVGTSCVLLGCVLSKMSLEKEFSDIMAITGSDPIEIDTYKRFLQYKNKKEKTTDKTTKKELFVVKKGIKKPIKNRAHRRVSGKEK